MNRPEITADQISLAARAFTYADEPDYVAAQLGAFFDLSDGQAVALRELAKLETERRAA